MIFAGHPGGVTGGFEERGEGLVGGQDMGIEFNDALSVLFGILFEVGILGTACEISGQDVITTRGADGRNHMLLEHEGSLAGKTVEVRGEVLALALREAVEMLGQHIIRNKEDDIGPLVIGGGFVCPSEEAEAAQGGEGKGEQ